MKNFDQSIRSAYNVLKRNGKLVILVFDEFDNHVLGHMDNDSIYNIWHS